MLISSEVRCERLRKFPSRQIHNIGSLRKIGVMHLRTVRKPPQYQINNEANFMRCDVTPTRTVEDACPYGGITNM